MRVGLLGFGTVGSHFYELVRGRQDVQVKTVLSRRPRTGVDARVTANVQDILQDPEIGIVVEVMGGLHPAYEYVCAAMRAGKHVVTANKLLMCDKYGELVSLAASCGVCLRCTAAVGGGIPWLTSLAGAAQVDTLTAVEGILNGTTNYILSAMTRRGIGFSEALQEAQDLGYAEADPAADVDGLDARRKLSLSADMAFGVILREEEVPCLGIGHITQGDIAAARDRGQVYKLVASAARREGRVSAYVCPALFAASTPEANLEGTGNLITLYGERLGRQSFLGAGAGGWPTGANVLRDCLAVNGGCESFYSSAMVPQTVDNTAAEGKWLFRVNGAYTTKRESVAEAFSDYARCLKEDPCAFMAQMR